MVLIEYKCNACGKVFDEFRPETGNPQCVYCDSVDTEQNLNGKCFGSFGSASTGGGCSGKCSSCGGCKSK